MPILLTARFNSETQHQQVSMGEPGSPPSPVDASPGRAEGPAWPPQRHCPLLPLGLGLARLQDCPWRSSWLRQRPSGGPTYLASTTPREPFLPRSTKQRLQPCSPPLDTTCWKLTTALLGTGSGPGSSRFPLARSPETWILPLLIFQISTVTT